MRDSTPRNAIDRFSVWIGHTTAWLTFLMVLVTFVIVVMRYVLGTGFIWLQESLTWMHAAVFMLGAAYTLHVDDHVRVDVFYRSMSVNRRAWINVLGVLIFVFPICGFLLLESWDYVSDSFAAREVSRNAGSLPYPAVPLLKSALLLMPLTVALQGASIVMKSLRTIRGRSAWSG